MKLPSCLSCLAAALGFAALMSPSYGDVAGWKVLAWNNLGMHCMDSDYRVFSILPPFNTLDAHIIGPDGLKKGPSDGITVYYEAVADPDGSITTSSTGRSNFWDNAQLLYGATLAPDQGLAGNPMPGPGNTPRPFTWVAGSSWWEAAGIPITPVDDHGRRQPYPLLRVTARNGSGTILAHADVVTPVSSEMDCRACHASGSAPAARPSAGWVNVADAELDFRLNILLLHDQQRATDTPGYAALLTTAGYSNKGLYDSAANQSTPVLCANCHASEALPGSGRAGVPPLTRSVHSRHASVISPFNNMTLDNATNRSACYVCHPGSDTRCLRGAMGSSVAPDGTLAMQCQSCHGSMSMVGNATRTGWLEEPNCQQCHTGTATQNSGAIRFTSVFDSPGHPRTPANATFATNPNTPPTTTGNLSLYRFSHGHGGLACSACHGSTHAIFPTSHRNDNFLARDLQGHTGTIAECTSCHAAMPNTNNGGPHGMHRIDDAWVGTENGGHTGAIEQLGLQACRACHGTDERGTVLSRTFGNRTFTTTQFGTKTWAKGHSVSCYDCHRGSGNTEPNPNHAPTVPARSLTVPSGASTPLALNGTDADHNTLTFRIVKQPQYGTVGLNGTQATYIPPQGYQGPDYFTYLAADGQTEGPPATVSLTVGNNGTLSDRDGDRLDDFLEYALGLDPDMPSVSVLEFAEGIDGKTYMTLSLGSGIQPPDATFWAEVSGDLKVWSSAPANVTIEQTPPRGLRVIDWHAVGDNSKHFLRLNASRP